MSNGKNKKTDVSVVAVDLYFLPVKTRVPLKFGPETLTSVECARTCVKVADRTGNTALGWGETPLSVQWAWPSSMEYHKRADAMRFFSRSLARAWIEFTGAGHPIELTADFLDLVLPDLLKKTNTEKLQNTESMPLLARLVCCSAFDIAIHDAYGKLHGVDVYDTYNKQFMNKDLADFLTPDENSLFSFEDKYPADFLKFPPPSKLNAWHLVGGKDPLDESELIGDEPDDGYPVILTDWIKRDCLRCLKVKLRGNDSDWDYQRLVKTGNIALDYKVLYLTADFNCTVTDPAYVNEILDKFAIDYPKIHKMILYVEQPFPYDLEKNQIDVHSLSERKPLFMDESAHNWKLIRLGRRLGWTGVALKTCKTQTGALLSLCWAKAHKMSLMVQDLTNPMLAQIPHVRLAAHADTIMGVETNAMQFYPDASVPEQSVHPGLYKRTNGCVDLSTVKGPGFGYRLGQIKRTLPAPCASFHR
jgi:L-alanine-DL-glutamate epimerase-like enolase superfamily enzyme